MFVAFLVFTLLPTYPLGLPTPPQQYIALESQKMMLFDYGQPFKLHRRTRTELYYATIKR